MNANYTGKYASIEFDNARHPNQFPQIVTLNQIRQDKGDTQQLPIDGLSRSEIVIS
jgi:hypothetical protein